MESQFTRGWEFHQTGLRFLIIILLVLGIFFRFVNLGKKVYWHDEALTSVTISGYTRMEIIQQVFNGHEIGIEDLQKYQRLNPEKSWLDTINSLAVDFPEHPPLYYVMARVWVQWFGNSVAVVRSLSAFLSLLVFPCLYWLCRELFEMSLVRWIALALIAISPFHVLYAQEAREYSLWTASILLSSAALLRTMRVTTKFSWGIYATTLALGCYIYPFSLYVAIGHGIYVVVMERFQWSKTVTAYLLASLAGLLTFIPWLLVIVTRLNTLTPGVWTAKKMALLSLVEWWILNLSRTFFDWNHNFRFENIFLYLIVFLVGYAVYFIYRNAPKRTGVFILTLIAVTAIALVLPDLIFGGRRSAVNRYLMPSYLGIQLAVAYLLARQITFFSNGWRQSLWRLVTLVLLSGGVISCAISSQSAIWWNKAFNAYNPQIAHIVNQSVNPLFISDTPISYDSSIGNIISLSYLLNPEVRLQLVVRKNIPQILKGFSDVFLFSPSRELREGLEKEHNSKLEPVYIQGRMQLLRLSKVEDS